MHQVPRPILTSGSRVASTIKDLQGVFNKGSGERRDSGGSQAPPIAPRGIRSTPPPRQDPITTKHHTTNDTTKHHTTNNGTENTDLTNNETLAGDQRKSSNSSDTRKISATSIRIGGNNNDISKSGENGSLRREASTKLSVVSIDQEKPALVKDHTPLVNNNKEELVNNMAENFDELEIYARKTSTYDENAIDEELMNDQLIEEELNKQNTAKENGDKKSFSGLNGLKIYDCKSDAKGTKGPERTMVSQKPAPVMVSQKPAPVMVSQKPPPVMVSQKPAGFVGFASLPEQVYRKALRKGFEFTLMVVGESGLGKSTLVNSMFLTDIYSSKFPGAIPRVAKTLEVETHKVLLEEGGVKLSLTVVDTPGFGDAVDNTDCWEPVTNFVEKQFEKFLEAETRVNRVELPDNRVHVCLYFIAPSGHGLKPLDIEFMSRLHDKVNIIPVIGKADACTTDEVKYFKEKILRQLSESKIKIYSFPEGEDGAEDWMRKRVPFAVVGSNTVIEEEEGGKRVRGRKYPWGTVNIENKNHCDFLPLRTLLLAHHMQDLKDVTNYVHYENFRCRRLTGVLSPEDGGSLKPNKNPLAALEDDQKDHEKKVERMRSEMEEVFNRKVEEKEQRLKESEKDLEERLEDSKDKLEEHKKDQEKQRELFEKEKKIWESTNAVSMEELTRRQSMETLVSSKKKRYGIGMMTFKIGK